MEGLGAVSRRAAVNDEPRAVDMPDLIETGFVSAFAK
jgi:hypothetical protein